MGIKYFIITPVKICFIIIPILKGNAMKALCLILITLLSYSCTKYADINKNAVGIEVSPVHMEIANLNDAEWFVGKRKEKKISQSFTFIVGMPKVREDDLQYLTDHRGVDAWILRLIAIRGSEAQDLGSLYAQFKPRKIGRGESGGATASVTIKVFYAAAYASERFRAFRCPAFGHNKKIESLQIVGENEPFFLTIGQSIDYKEKSHLIELSPSAFNGGNSLTGDYFVEIAAYNSQKKTIHSSFKRIPMSVSISQEEEINIPSCLGVHSEIENQRPL
jgi:hypothetical protein